MTAKTDRDDDPEPHELFLPQAETDPIVSPVWISIEREKPFREAHGGVIAPHELPDQAAIAEQFGTGTYFVRARDARKRVIAGRRIVCRNAGPPKAMDGSGELVEGFTTPERIPDQRPQREGPSELGALLAYMQTAQTAQAAQTAAMMAAERDRNQAFIQAMTAANNQTTSAILDVMKAQVAAKPAESGGDQFEKVLSTFSAGISFANETRAEAQKAIEETAGPGGKDSFETSLVQLAQGWVAAKAQEPPTSNGNGGTS